MTEQDQRNIEAVRRMYRGESEESKTIAPDIVWHVPGHNPVAGDYRGYEAYTELMPSRMAPLTQWDFAVGDVMVNGDYVVATFSLKGERKGKTVDLRGAHIMRLNAQGQIVEGWGFTNDQAALDDFFSRGSTETT
ncbi:MAG TPA: nuclear transport factor 2 family protein [Anaerolineae bacterium]|nr:nuclear transport factor 2 family protein [Anaerolineae bacterium]